MQSLCNKHIQQKWWVNYSLFPIVTLFFYSLTAMVTGFTCARLWIIGTPVVSDVTTGVPIILMATGFLWLRWSMVSAWRHKICFCCKGKQMRVWVDIISPDSNRFGLRVTSDWIVWPLCSPYFDGVTRECYGSTSRDGNVSNIGKKNLILVIMQRDWLSLRESWCRMVVLFPEHDYCLALNSNTGNWFSNLFARRL